MKINKTIVLAITGASGLPYTRRLLQCLVQEKQNIFLIFTESAQIVSKLEINWELDEENPKATLLSLEKDLGLSLFDHVKIIHKKNWFSAPASGSNPPDAMIICPASMGTISAICHGQSDNLIERAADVCIKEKKQLIVTPRETPLSTIHLKNLLTLSQLGVEIIPLMPGFYQKPKNISDIIDFMVMRILDHLSIETSLIKRWSEKN